MVSDVKTPFKLPVNQTPLECLLIESTIPSLTERGGPL